MKLYRWTSSTTAVLTAVVLALGTALARADVIDFEDASLGGSLTPPNPPTYMGDHWPTSSDSYGSHDFTSHGVTFASYTGYDTSSGVGYYYWGDWAISNAVDTLTRGFTNQYSAITGGGAGGSQTFGLLYGDASGLATGEITIPQGMHVQQAEFTNTTYAYYEMLLGSEFGHYSFPLQPGDWVNMTIRGYDDSDALIGEVVLDLGEYPQGSQAPDLLDDWQLVDLSSLADARTLRFVFDESPGQKVGIYMSHPSYIAMDKLVLVSDSTGGGLPEPSAFVLAALGGMLLLARRRSWRAR